jgi:uncharacterized protein
MTTEVRHAADFNRYELWDGDRMIGIADYREAGEGVFVFPHTEIATHRRGEGLGEVLVRGALDDVRRRGGHVVPACWFVADFVGSNPAYEDLVAS